MRPRTVGITVGLTGEDRKAEQFRLTIPAEVAKLVPRDSRFAAELTEEGILFRFVQFEAPVVPGWAASA